MNKRTKRIAILVIMVSVLLVLPMIAMAAAPTGDLWYAYLNTNLKWISVDIGSIESDESLELWLYSGDTLLTTAYANNPYIPGNMDELTASIALKERGTSNWWPTDAWKAWKDVVPTHVDLYVDGEKVDTVKVTTGHNQTQITAGDWDAFPGTLNPADRVTSGGDAVPSDKEIKNLPKTGDESNLMLFATLLAMSAAGVLLLRRRSANR